MTERLKRSISETLCRVGRGRCICLHGLKVPQDVAVGFDDHRVLPEENRGERTGDGQASSSADRLSTIPFSKKLLIAKFETYLVFIGSS